MNLNLLNKTAKQKERQEPSLGQGVHVHVFRSGVGNDVVQVQRLQEEARPSKSQASGDLPGQGMLKYYKTKNV